MTCIALNDELLNYSNPDTNPTYFHGSLNDWQTTPYVLERHTLWTALMWLQPAVSVGMRGTAT